MITVKNVTNGETKNVYNVKVAPSGAIVPNDGKKRGARFVAMNADVLTLKNDEPQEFSLRDEWTVVTKGTRRNATKAATDEPTTTDEPKQAKANAASETPASNASNASNAASETPKGDAKATPAANDSKPTKAAPKATKPARQPAANDLSEAAKAFAEAVSKAKAATIDEAKVREICAEVIASQQATPAEAANTLTVKVLGENDTHKVSNPHPLLKKVLPLVVNDRIIGRFPWLFGPAGSGKSTLAKQIAEALGLPFYSVSSLQQKYELEGYTDAVGELVVTTFYKASTEGGVFLFDEASTSSGEVQVAWNSMLANLWYNFPKVGMVKAHKDFHVIAADNTTGRGGNSTYSARFQLDASTLDRYTAIEVGYTKEHDLYMAEGDEDLVVFFDDLRNAISEARLTYTASPRALRAIKQMQKLTDTLTEREAFELGLCSSWAKADIKTLAARLFGTNKYYKMFNAIANA